MLSLVPHFLHFPFCIKKLTSGISSIADKLCQHLSHFERQKSIDLIHFLFHSLLISTHQNEPKIVHKINNISILQIIMYYKQNKIPSRIVYFITKKSRINKQFYSQLGLNLSFLLKNVWKIVKYLLESIFYCLKI